MTDDRVQPDSLQEWREWLAAHHTRPAGVWLVTWRAGSSGPRIGYEESVEQALCFGWVDSSVVKGDDGTWLQRFSPRNPRSTWAASNRERAEKLIAAGLMRPAGQALIDLAKRTGRWDVLGSVGGDGVPDDLRAALAADPQADANFAAFTPSARRLILEWILTARKPETRARRIAKTVASAHNNTRAYP